jgi:ribonuclease T1
MNAGFQRQLRAFTPRGVWQHALIALLTIWSCMAIDAAWARSSAEQRDLPTVSAAQLPNEARVVMRAIRMGGPFPYRKDGSVFGNRERRLPRKPSGYYREYTVPTPGSPDRGARRIIAGSEGEMYYTDDHYRNFRRITE